MLACTRAVQFSGKGTSQFPVSVASASVVLSIMANAADSGAIGPHMSYCGALAAADEGTVIAAIIDACGAGE